MVNKDHLKTECDEEDKNNIMTVMRFPQIEDLDANDCVHIYLKPLYNNIDPFLELLKSFSDDI